MTLEWIGWIATALFALSYFCKTPKGLLRVQLVAALVWILYGWGLRSRPVVVANLAVASAAGYSAWRSRKASTQGDGKTISA